MTNYQGPATLIVGDREIEVVARLTIRQRGNLPGWNGVVQADPSEDFWDLAQGNGPARLRLPDGKEGDVIHDSSTTGTGSARITGSGAPPF